MKSRTQVRSKAQGKILVRDDDDVLQLELFL